MSRDSYSIRDMLMKQIRRDSANILSKVAAKLKNASELVGGETKNVDINKTLGGADITYTADVPLDKIDEFTKAVDEEVRGSFKFSNWSDMRI